MTELNQPFLSQVTYLLNFRSIAQKIRFEQAQAEDAFAKFIGVQSTQTNVPDDADPNLARIVFQTNKKSIAISQTACQLSMAFKNAELPVAKQIEIAKGKISEFYTNSLKFKEAEKFGMTAVIFEINFSAKNANVDLQEYLYDQFIKTPKISDVASVQVNLGYKINNHFLNFGASVYEIRNFEVSGSVGQIVNIDINEMKTIDTGLAFKIDINNRPMLNSNKAERIEEPGNLLSTLDDFISGQFEKISGFKIG